MRAEPGLRNRWEAIRKLLEDAAIFNHSTKALLLADHGRGLSIPAANLAALNAIKLWAIREQMTMVHLCSSM